MPVLSLTHEDIAFVVNCVPPAFTWPANHDDADFLPIADREHGGGAALRLRLLAARQYAKVNPGVTAVNLEVTVADLWALDTVLWQMDYTRTKMYSGTPVLRLVEKIWDAITTYHRAAIQSDLHVGDKLPISAEQRERLRVLDIMIDGESSL